ncbi:MAG TPA: MAP7 domain-containing protein [Candidatus Lokiarchaeia archaeon]|nr:MAP7 domain-containing protein [Candidatus Lokiarchaeia archaeon]
MDPSEVDAKREEAEKLFEEGKLDEAKSLAQEIHDVALDTGDQDLQELMQMFLIAIEGKRRKLAVEGPKEELPPLESEIITSSETPENAPEEAGSLDLLTPVPEFSGKRQLPKREETNTAEPEPVRDTLEEEPAGPEEEVEVSAAFKYSPPPPAEEEVPPAEEEVSPAISETPAVAVTSQDQQFITSYYMFVIPSWHKALGAPLGKYLNQQIKKIDIDAVIFFVSKEAAVETPQGTVYALFGLGYYYAKFQLADKRDIVDKKPLTCLLLADFVYDKIAKSRTLALGTEPDIFVCDEVFKVPMDLSEKPEPKLPFIKGMLTRYLFVPLKDAIHEMLEQIADPTAYDLGAWGHLVLSTLWDHYNSILVGYPGGPTGFKDYMKSTASVRSIEGGASKLLAEMISPANLQEVADSIQVLKNVYGQVENDLIDVYILLGHVADLLKQNAPPPSPEVPAESAPGALKSKHSVLVSAQPRIDSVAEWPEPLQGKPEEKATEVEIAAEEPEFKEVVHQFHKKEASYEGGDASDLTATQIEAAEKESYELRHLQRGTGAQKQLPQAPTGDLEEIFLYLKYIIDEGYDLPSVGRAFEYARESLKKIQLTSTYVREMSRWANQFVLKAAGVGLSAKEKTVVLRDVDAWLAKEQEQKRMEAERLEKARLAREEAERIENARQEKERRDREEADRIKKETLARKEKERLEQEAEHLKQERLEKERLEREEAERLEKERLEQERLEKERLDREKAEAVLHEREKIAQQKVDLKRIQQERKKAEKEENARQKKLKALAKEQAKLEKKKKQEEERLKKLKPN